MERDMGLYVRLCSDGTINRTLRSARGETELGDITIGDDAKKCFKSYVCPKLSAYDWYS